MIIIAGSIYNISAWALRCLSLTEGNAKAQYAG